MAKLNIFFTGGTGFIGGTVLDRILKHPQANNFSVTALVRSEEKAEALKSLGIQPVRGTYTDLAILEEQASKADIVLEVASSDDEKANVAILRGLKAHFQSTGKVPILIHASGAGFLVDDAFGSYVSEEIVSDNDADTIEAIPAEKWHRPVDTAIVQAAKEGYVKTFIVAPGFVYGTPTGRLADIGAQKTLTGAVSIYVQLFADKGAAILPNEGKNLWAYVHVNDCADLFYTLFDNALEGKDFGSGREGFYFAETGEHSTAEYLSLLATALHKAGKIPSVTPVPPASEGKEYFMIKMLGGNARCRGERSRAAGWKPIIGETGFLANLQKDIDTAIAAL